MAENAMVRVLEGQHWIDRAAEPVGNTLFGALSRVPWLRSALDGTWLGHPLHAALTDVPIGAWTAGQALDLVELFGGSRSLRRGADAVQMIGVVGALGAAVAGLADWSYTRGRTRRLGFVHGISNVVIAGLYGASLLARARRRRGLGIALSSTGYGLLMFSSWLGGELAYRHGIGVNRNAFATLPSDWTAVAAEHEVREGEMRRVEAGRMAVLLTRRQGQLLAIGDTCTHLGCSLAGGRIEGDRVVCPCHGSQFRLSDGRVMAGPATMSEPRFEVRVRAGRIEVRPAPEESRVKPGAPARVPSAL